jgi:hypothetical protein
MSTSPQTTLAADAYLAEGQLLYEHTLNEAKSDILSRNSETRRTEFRTKVNLNKKECIEDASLYIKCAILTPPKQENGSNDVDERND